jgi:hypothetical protein
MAITLHERYDSPRRTVDQNGEVETRHWAKGSDDDQEILDHALDHLPSVHSDLPRQQVVVEPLGGGMWDIVARYAPNSQSAQPPIPPPEVGDSEFSFDTSGGTQHITQAIETVGVYPDPAIGVASDWQGAIGVTDDGVEGVDILVPQLAYEETHQIAHATVVGGMVGVIHSLTAKVNNATFKGFAAGELLFVGARGRRRKSEGFWTITFMFTASRNATSLVVGPITVAGKDGWDYLDTQYEAAEDETASMLVRRPVCARVHRVYERADFSALGI